jgi:hypothetical protein
LQNLVSYYLLLLLSLSVVSITVAETTNQTSRTALKRLDQGGREIYSLQWLASDLFS